MSAQTIAGRCPKCGTQAAVRAAEGLCAACLLEAGLEFSSFAGNATPDGFLARFGDYELLNEIARGGMGVVYRARQVSLNRPVAVKMILSGSLAGESERQRFRAEAETAARLQHPHIVAIHEVGEHEGHPFFSMDLVEGQSLTQLTRNEPVPARRAAQYLKTIAEAVQFAHSRGVLHRDLKPSNILIDQADQPRVTDFGLAKRLDSAAAPTPQADLTQTGHVLGSPNFMPPEQAAGHSRDVGAASDVYSLGAVLYQLLTGRAPFMAETVTQTLRLVAETEPVAPRLLVPTIPHDLETICLKCLEKDPARRYTTAKELADELDRYLNDEPIQARAVSGAEKFWRWCRRKPALAGSFGAAAVLLLIVAIGAPIALFHIDRERQRADAARKNETALRQQAEADRKQAQSEATKSQQVAKFLQDMLGGVGPSVALGRDTTLLREILEKTAERVGKDLTNQPAVEAELKATIGKVYFGLGDFKKAEALNREALALRRKLFGHEHLDVASSLNGLAVVLGEEGKYVEGEAYSREALALQRKLLGPENAAVALSLNTLGVILAGQGKAAEAEPLYRESLALRRKLFGNEHGDVAISLNSVGNTLSKSGNSGEAEAMYREAIRIHKNLGGTNNPDLEVPLNNLANILLSAGKLDEAEAATREGLALQRNILGPDHPHIVRSLYIITYVLEKQSQLSNAVSFGRELVTLQKRRAAVDPGGVSKAFARLVALLEKQGRQPEIEDALRDHVEFQMRNLGNDHRDTQAALKSLASVLAKQGKLGDRINVGGQQVDLPPDLLGELYARRAKWKEAMTNFVRAIELKLDAPATYSHLSVLLADSGDVEKYRLHCQRFLAQFAGTTNPGTADGVAKACLILPSSGVDLHVADDLAKRAVTLGSKSEYLPWFHLCKSLADYRLRNFEAATNWSQMALTKKGWLLERDAAAYLVLAMAQMELKQESDARVALSNASEIVERELPRLRGDDLGKQWFDGIIAQILLREAKALIETAQPPESAIKPSL